MRQFLILALKFGSPLILMVLVYVVLDPFKLVRPHSSFYEAPGGLEVAVNRGYINTETFDENYDKYNYDSFIFGNSRSIFYNVSDWIKHLPANSSPYHFDSSAESLYGIYRKVLYIDDHDLKINNVLMVLDHLTLEQDKPRTGQQFAIAPQLVNYTNLLEFHMIGFRSFYNKDFITAYTDYMINGEPKGYMTKGAMLMNSPRWYDSKTNEVRWLNEEDLDSGKYYTPEQMAAFYERKDFEPYPAALKETHIELLTEIAGILKKHHTNCKIIINPLYDQKKINKKDLEYLKKIFGSNNVFDFSGKNEITEDYRNYYEDSHYRPKVAKLLLDKVYGAKEDK